MIIAAFVKYRPKTAVAKIVDLVGISAGTKIAYKFDGEILVINRISSFYRNMTAIAIQEELKDLAGKDFDEKVELLKLIFDKPKSKILKMNKTGNYES